MRTEADLEVRESGNIRKKEKERYGFWMHRKRAADLFFFDKDPWFVNVSKEQKKSRQFAENWVGTKRKLAEITSLFFEFWGFCR